MAFKQARPASGCRLNVCRALQPARVALTTLLGRLLRPIPLPPRRQPDVLQSERKSGLVWSQKSQPLFQLGETGGARGKSCSACMSRNVLLMNNRTRGPHCGPHQLQRPEHRAEFARKSPGLSRDYGSGRVDIFLLRITLIIGMRRTRIRPYPDDMPERDIP
jgi:hypothetical protein